MFWNAAIVRSSTYMGTTIPIILNTKTCGVLDETGIGMVKISGKFKAKHSGVTVNGKRTHREKCKRALLWFAAVEHVQYVP